jgi:hypothetical protein
MPPFTVHPTTAADGPEIGRLNVEAFWTDPTWRCLWPGKERDYVASQAALRGPFTLIREPANRRHLKVVDEETGRTVGYARWILPGAKDVEEQWPEAKVATPSAEEKKEAVATYSRADWAYSHDMDYLDGPVLAVKDRELSKRKLICEPHCLSELLKGPPY